MSVRKKRMVKTLLYYALVLSIAALMMYPLLWLISSSFKPSADIFVNAHILIPKTVTAEHYISGWKGFGNITFATFFKNSFFICVVSTAAQVLSSAVVAYGFSRIPFTGSKIWFGIMISTLMLPAQVLLVPQYIIYNGLGLLDTYYPIMLPHFFGTPFFIFLLMQFIRGIPRDLDEAAKIDGCSRYAIFVRVIMPLCGPALITAGIFSFYWKWEEFLGPHLFLQTVSKYTVALALRLFTDPSSASNWGGAFAMSVLSILPVFLVFVSLQKYLVEGISTSGLKG